jgi:alpha-galactosidase
MRDGLVPSCGHAVEASVIELVQLVLPQPQTTADRVPSKSIAVMQLGKWRIEYGLSSGTADIYFSGKLLISQAYAEARLPEIVTSKDYRTHVIKRRTIHDRFGRGIKYEVDSSNGGDGKMAQSFWLYDNLDYMLADVEMSGSNGIASNFLSPLTSQTASKYLPSGDDRALFVPFDNDMWVRYNAVPFGGVVTSYEVSALYENASREGLIIGSVEHDKWKTGITSTTSSNAITSLAVFGGIASSNITHDVLPHGKVIGKTINSPKIFLGYFADWRNGLETYAEANAAISPPRPWKGGVAFGWNSWGKLQFGLTFKKAMEVSDFFAKKLPQFSNNGVVYIGLDAGWNVLRQCQ